jgi:hypothetical protein
MPAWKHREVSQHAREDARLAAPIQQIYQEQTPSSTALHAFMRSSKREAYTPHASGLRG